MKKLFIFLSLFSLPLGLSAQSELPKDTTLLKRLPATPEVAQPAIAFPIATPHETPAPATPGIDLPTLKVSPPATAIPYPAFPWMEVKMGKMVSTYDPNALDYEQYAAFRLSNTATLNTFSTYNTYPTMGTIIQAGAYFIYRVGKHWEFTGGAYAAQYTIPSRMHGSQMDLGLNASLGYRFNKHLLLRIYGQYSGFGRQNSFNGYMNPAYPQSYYGAALEWKINDYLELQGGVERTYSPTKMKWVTVPVLRPVIYFNRKK